MRTIALIAALCVAVLTTGIGNAEPLPKKGTFTGKFGWYAVGKVTELEKGHVFFVGEFSGVFFNDTPGGALDTIGVQCPGANQVVFASAGAHHAGNGVCTLIDTDGDKIFSTWEVRDSFPNDSAPADWQMIGGTGKYAGIRGKNKFQCYNNTNASTGYCKWWVSYEMP